MPTMQATAVQCVHRASAIAFTTTELRFVMIPKISKIVFARSPVSKRLFRFFQTSNVLRDM